MIASCLNHPLLRDRLVPIAGAAMASAPDVALPPFAHEDFAAWRPVARGPSLPADGLDPRHDSWLWAREGVPGALWFGPMEDWPPGLFLTVRAPEDLVAILDRFFPEEPRLQQPTRKVSVALGLVRAHRDLEGRLEADPFLHREALKLGGEPTDEVDDPEGSLVLIESAFATRWSHSLIAVEGWSDFIPDIRVELARVGYVPAPDAEVVRRYNGAYGTTWPEDVPLDVIGALHGMLGWTADAARAQVEGGDEPGLAVLLMGLLLADDPPRALAALDALRDHAHPGVAESARDLAQWLREAFGAH